MVPLASHEHRPLSWWTCLEGATDLPKRLATRLADIGRGIPARPPQVSKERHFLIQNFAMGGSPDQSGLIVEESKYPPASRHLDQTPKHFPDGCSDRDEPDDPAVPVFGFNVPCTHSRWTSAPCSLGALRCCRAHPVSLRCRRLFVSHGVDGLIC